jgi:tetratricopeptide (TPR) repeat protein
LALRQRSLAVVGCAVAGTLLLVTMLKAAAWRNDVTLWTASSLASPGSILARVQLAKALLEAGDLAAARAVAREVAARFPEDPRADLLAGRVDEAGGTSSDALRHYERAIALGATDAGTLQQAAVLSARLQAWDRAGHWLRVAARRYPDAAWAQMGLGWYLERQGRLDLAQAHFGRAATLEPRGPERLWLWSQLLASEGRRTEAVLAAQAALALDPGFLPARRALALVAEQAGQTAEAITHWRHIAAAGPGAPRSEALEHLRRLEVVAAGTSPATSR